MKIPKKGEQIDYYESLKKEMKNFDILEEERKY